MRERMSNETKIEPEKQYSIDQFFYNLLIDCVSDCWSYYEDYWGDRPSRSISEIFIQWRKHIEKFYKLVDEEEK